MPIPTETPTASAQITREVTTWPGIEAGYGRREIGHLHGDHAAHFFFPKDVWHELHDAGRIVEHPVFPGRVGPAARRIESPADVEDVIAMLRLNYERRDAERARRALPAERG